MSLDSVAKNLRKNSTETERFLWKQLRAKRFSGFKFRRQEPIGDYIIDFVCFERRTIIECDGGQHLLQTERDKKRDRWFENQGYKVLRFWDNEVLKNTEEVLRVIYEACTRGHPPPDPLPSREGELEKIDKGS